MGYYDALQDGIKQHKHGSWDMYLVKCHLCGEEIESPTYERGKIYICKTCREIKSAINKLEASQERVVLNKDTKNRKLQNALRRISRVEDQINYDYAACVVEEMLHTDGWFNSTEEIMVALELIRNNVKFLHQVKCGKRYVVDFILPDAKVILEVDGVLYHSSRAMLDKIRDEIILEELGKGWRVVRVTDKFVNTDIAELIYYINGTTNPYKYLV